MLKLLHTADWHPRSQGPIGGKLSIDPNTGMSWSLTDFNESLRWLASVIKEESPDAMILAGDVFDTPNPTTDEYMAVMNFLEHIRANQVIPIFAVSGNHDIYQSGTGAAATHLTKFTQTFCAQAPTTLMQVLQGHLIRFDFLPYPSRGRIMATMDLKGVSHEEVDALINRKLSDVVRGFTVGHGEDEIRILIGHGSVSMAKVNEQPRSLAHDIQLPVKEFENAYHYIALGHIHQMQQLTSNAWYSGSLMRQGFGEEQEAKGVLMVRVDQKELDVKFIENPHSRTYKTLRLDELAGLHGEFSTVYRVKAKVSAEELARYEEDIIACQNTLPYFQVDVEVVKDDRQRDSGMTNGMTPDQALDRCLAREAIEDPLLSEIRSTHQVIMEELR